jgi:tetratricopeptide (TPR) repeat protein
MSFSVVVERSVTRRDSSSILPPLGTMPKLATGSVSVRALRSRRLLLVVFFVIGSVLKGQSFQDVQSEESLLRQAEALISQGHKEEAIPLLQDYVRHYPHDVQGYVLLGRSYAENSQIAQARKVLQHAVAIDPKSATAHLSLGVVEVLAGDRDAGTTEFRYVLEIDPNHQAALYNLGKLSFDEGDYTASLAFFGRYLNHNSSDSNALIYMLRCALATQDRRTAQQLESRLRSLESRNAAFHARIGKWLGDAKLYEAADKEFALAAQMPDASPGVLHDYASLLLKESRPQEALEILSRVPESAANGADHHYLLGQCYERALDPRDAYREYSKAISIDPAQETYYASLAWLLLSQQATDAAKGVLSTAERRFPNSAAITVAKGFLQLEIGDLEKATEAYRAAVQMKPDFPMACKLLGRIEMAKGNYLEAIQIFKRAAQLAPLDPQPPFFEGLAYARVVNGTDMAIDCFLRSLKLNSELADRYFWLGSLYFHRKHEYELAKKYSEEAVRRAPSWAPANQLLIQCYRLLGENRLAAETEIRFREAVRQTVPGSDFRAFLDTQRSVGSAHAPTD